MNSVSIPLDVILDHPCLDISEDKSNIIYSGHLIVNATLYNIKVREYLEGNRKRFEFFDIDNSLYTRYPGILEKISGINQDNISIYLKEISNIIENYNPPLKNYAANYRKVIVEFKEFSKFYIDLRVLELCPNLSSIKVSFVDQGNREHFLEFGVDYKKVSEIFFFKKFDVPKKENSFLFQKSSNLKELYSLFLVYIEELQPFFDFMDVIDANCTVIDPKQPERKFCYRRISLEKNVSVIITVDPFNINYCPNFTFVGPDKLTNKFQCRLKENLDKWNDSDYLYEQLLLIFGLEQFPKNINALEEKGVNEVLLVSDDDCCICYASEVNEFLPDVVCGNKSCGSMYHRHCLSKWLSSIDSKKYFNDIQGPCPNCENMISCTILT